MRPMAIRSTYGRPAARPNQNRQPSAEIAQIPPPIEGWDTQSPVALMKPARAVRMDNFIPREGYVEMRRGSTTFATGIDGAVETLMVWRGPTVEQMFAASPTSIFEVSDGGVVAAPAVGSLSNGRWQYVNFGTPGGHYIRAVNGSDTPLVYNGVSWGTSPAITGSGLAATALIDVFAFKQRLFFIEKDSARFWYLDPIAVGGAAHVFDLASIFSKGGSLVSGATWSIDGGAGPDDLAVFLSSEGQAAIYRGIDPGSADDWGLVGVFDLARPIGRRCIIKLGGDLGILAESGFLPLQQSLIGTAVAANRTAITNRINNAFQAAAGSYGQNFGWQPITYDGAGLIVINVPLVERGTSHQYVMNSTTGAWCRLTGMPANCLGIFDGLIYFGGNGTVSLADTGYRDNGAPITGDLLTAFSSFKHPGRKKHFGLVRPMFRQAINVEPQVEVVTDFADVPPMSTPTVVSATWPTAKWGVAKWGVAKWGKAQQIHLDVAGAMGIGLYGAVRLRMVTADDSANVGLTSTSTLQVLGFDVSYQVGGIL